MASKVGIAEDGDTLAFHRLEKLQTGERFAATKAPPAKPPRAPLPAPTQAVALHVKERKDEVRLAAALAKLCEEDPALSAKHDAESGELKLAGQGEMHLRVVAERLADRFGVAVDTNKPSVAYRETIRDTVTVRGRHKKQSGGHGQFGDVLVEVGPRGRGEDFLFAEKIHGGSVPRQYFSSVEIGAKDGLARGPLGFKVVDVAVTLLDGSYLVAGFDRAVHDPDQRDDADVVVEPGVDDEGLERAIGVALGGRNPPDEGFEKVGNALACLRAHADGVGGVDADDLFDLFRDAVGVGGREVDLVDDGEDFDALLDRRVAVRDALGFDALGGIDNEERAVAGRQRARDFVGEVHVAGGVDHVQLVALSILGVVIESDARRLDGDSALTLERHGVEHLRLHLAVLQAAAELDEPVGQGGFTVIDVGNNREVTYEPHESAICPVTARCFTRESIKAGGSHWAGRGLCTSVAPPGRLPGLVADAHVATGWDSRFENGASVVTEDYRNHTRPDQALTVRELQADFHGRRGPAAIGDVDAIVRHLELQVRGFPEVELDILVHGGIAEGTLAHQHRCIVAVDKRAHLARW